MIIFQKVESAVLFVALSATYYLLDFSWLVFVLLILMPDVSMAGYLFNPKTGAVVYNIGHSYVVPVVLLGGGVVLHFEWAVMGAIIWAAHIAADRALGYGLKLPAGFQHTHLGVLKRRGPL